MWSAERVRRASAAHQVEPFLVSGSIVAALTSARLHRFFPKTSHRLFSRNHFENLIKIKKKPGASLHKKISVNIRTGSGSDRVHAQLNAMENGHNAVM